jgi:hypothetical protein
MFRKTTFALAAALIALAPAVAFAKGGGHGGHGGFRGGFHGGHGGHGGHHGHHQGHKFHRHVGFSVVAGGGCYRYRWVETRFGLVKRLVNVCNFYY